MNTLTAFLENLRPGGASNIPKSKLNQELTLDSDLESPEPQKPTEPPKAVKSDIKGIEQPQRPKRKITKQAADVQHQSSEFEDIKSTDVPTNKENQAAAPNTSSNQSNQSNPTENDNENIRKHWEKLGIGKDGYLTLPELEIICNYYGMNDMDKEDIHNLFLIIDTDKDNKVSLTEFSNGIKYHDKLKKASAEMEEKTKEMKRQRSHSLHSCALIAPLLIMPNTNLNHLFSTLDPNKSGFMNANKIADFWISGGILNGLEVLEYLNIKARDNVNLVELSALLDKEMLMADLDGISLSCFITYQKELQYCRSLIQLITKIQDSKLYVNDVEKRMIHDLQGQIVSLQEMNKVELIKQKKEDESTINELMLNKNELTERISKLNKEMSTTDYEYAQLKKKISEVQELNVRQEEELDAVAELHRKMELELNLLRDAKLIFNQTMTKNDRDELYALKKKFEQQFERANNASLRHISEANQNKKNLNSFDEKTTMSSRSMNDLEKKLQMKIDEVRYLRKELDDSRYAGIDKEKDNNQIKLKEMEMYLSFEKKKLKDYKDENENLRNIIQGLESKVDIAINREKLYRKKIDDFEKNEMKSQNMENILDETRKDYGVKEKMNEMKIVKLSKRIEELEVENIEFNKEYTNLEKEHIKNTEEIKTLNKSLIKKNKEIEDQMNEISEINDVLRSSKEDLKLNKIMVDKLESANDRLSKSLKNAANKINEFSHQNFDSDSKSITNENIKIQKENMLLEDEVNQLKRRLASDELSQSNEFIVENRNLQNKLKEKEMRIEELEESLHRKNSDMRSNQFGSAKKIDQLQFKYEELNKKYQLQLEQVDKVDSLLSDLYKENSKLMKSLQRSEENKEQNEIKIIQLEEQINTLQNILNRKS